VNEEGNTSFHQVQNRTGTTPFLQAQEGIHLLQKKFSQRHFTKIKIEETEIQKS